MELHLIVDIIITLFCAGAAFIPTSIMLSEKGSPKRKIETKRQTVVLFDFSQVRIAIAGNTAAIIVVNLTTAYSSNQVLVKLKIGIGVIAFIGLIWGFVQYKIAMDDCKRGGVASLEAQKIDMNPVECKYLAQIVNIQKEKGYLQLRNVYVWIDGGWFPYSYPCWYKEEDQLSLFVYDTKELMELDLQKDEWISFFASARCRVNMANFSFSLKGGAYFKRVSFEKPAMRENPTELWYETEKLVCKACRYSGGCKNRHAPCVMITEANSGWTRKFLSENYPNLVENEVKRVKERLEDAVYVEALLSTIPKKLAKKAGFEDGGVLIIATSIGNNLPTGTLIQSFDGKRVHTEQEIDEILTKHKVGDIVSVRIQQPNQSPVECKTTLVGNQKIAELIFQLTPFFIRSTPDQSES